MLRSCRHSIAWMPVCRSLDIRSLQVSLRLRGAGFRRYSSSPNHFHPNYNRHWFRHVIVAFSPSGICPLPFLRWLGFPEGFIPSPYQVGKVRWFLIESCEPDWSFSEKLMKSLEGNVSEDTQFLIERKMVAHWMESMLAYYKWYLNALSDYSISCDVLLDPPAFVFRPARKEQLNKFHKYGRMFRAYDLVRQEPVPLPLGEIPRPLYYVDVVYSALWLKSNEWFHFL